MVSKHHKAAQEEGRTFVLDTNVLLYDPNSLDVFEDNELVIPITVIEEIDRLERSDISEVRYLQYEPHYAAFVIGAMVFMLTSSLLSGTWLRRLP